MTQISDTDLALAIREQWPNMPNSDIDKCIKVINEASVQFHAPLTALVSRKSYLAVEGEGLDFRLAYVHFGHVRIRDERSKDKYSDVGILANYNKKPRVNHKHQHVAKQLCPECFLELPTSGAACVCQD